MEIIVCVKRVPDLSETELAIARDGQSLETDDLDYGINEWDNFAVEAAVSLRETHGGRVTAMTIGDEEAEEVLRRALAMGADEAVHLCDEAFEGSDAFALATILHGSISKRPHDLVLCGSISGDEGRGHVGGMLAALLDIPHVSLATDLSVEGTVATVRHEVEGGLERVVQMDLPALVTVQTGINEPRYVSIRGIRKVASKEVEQQGLSDLGLEPALLGPKGAQVRLEELSLPARGEGAEILKGDPDSTVEALYNRLAEQGAF